MVIPTEQVLNMRTQGMSSSQISELLQRDGFAINDVLEAMKQADIKAVVQPFPTQQGDIMVENPINPQGMNQQQMQGMQPPQGMPPMQGMPQQQEMQQPQGMPPMQGMPPQQEMQQPMGQEPEYVDDERGRIEEIAEAIIDEKWSELLNNVNRIIEWKEKTEQRITTIEADFKGMKESFDKLHVGILEKVGQYDSHIQDVGTEVRALEKVFQKVLPGFIENVSELTRVTQTLKKMSSNK